MSEPAYLIVVGVDRIAYALRLTERLGSRKASGLPGDFYPLSAPELEALAGYQRKILFAEHLQPDIIERLEGDIARLEAKLGDGQALCEEDMAAFRRANIALEVLFVTRAFDGSLRQNYIGRIAAIAGLLARWFLAHPRETLLLAQAKATCDHEELVASTGELFVQVATDCAGYVSTLHVPRGPKQPVPPAIRRRHALLVAEGIDNDLPDRLTPLGRRALQEWIIAHYDEPGAALGNGDSRLPNALAAVRTVEEKIVLERDMGTEPEEMGERLSRVALAGASGDQRRRRLERLLSILEGRGIALPQEIGALLPFWGIKDLLYCAAVLPDVALTVAQAWLDRRLPALSQLHAALVQANPPSAPGAKYAWAAVRLEAASRFLLLRAAAHKPLWQGPYGARYLINRELLPLWRRESPPTDLLAALVDEAVLGTDVPRQASDRVREYLNGKLISPANLSAEER